MSSTELEHPTQSSDLSHPLEQHRALIRETDRAFSRVYGFGGGAVVSAALAVLIVAWVLGILWNLATFVVAITVALLGLFVLRSVVNKKRSELRASVESYCELNELELQSLRDYARDEGIYTYFEAVFESRR